jgi:hypothetical protein
MPSMPRKASPTSPDVASAVLQIKAYCEETTTSVLALSQNAGVEQSALARFLSGERKSITPAAKKVLALIGERHNRHNQHSDTLVHQHKSDAHGCRLINEAINSLWDGRRQSAEVIASLVLALKPAIELAAGPKHGGQTRK